MKHQIDYKTEKKLCTILQLIYDLQQDKKFMRDLKKWVKKQEGKGK